MTLPGKSDNSEAPKVAASDQPSQFSRKILETPWLPALIVAVGFAARLYRAWTLFLNPDEALHVLLASQLSVALAYKAALTNAHPPLLILLLYYWRHLGTSELMLRLPSVLAGTACCWIAYLWLKQICGRAAAIFGLMLLALSPTFIQLSAEVRQYALLLFFMAVCLWLSERAMRENSVWLMAWFSLSLYGALLVHYSALLFAFAMGIYMLVRLYPYRQHVRLTVTWAIGQIGGVVVSSYFVFTHLLRMRHVGLLSPDYDTYLRRSVFHAGDSSVAGFAAAQTLRVFTYFFSHGLIGALILLAFLGGLFALVQGKSKLASGRAVALLIALGFALSCGAGLAGQYPYGATRHSAWLLIFAVTGASAGLAWMAEMRGQWLTAALLASALVVCNVFPSPPPSIRTKNQQRALMSAAVDSFRQSAQPADVVITDYQGGLLFGYYVCGHGVAQVFLPMQPLARAECGEYTVISPSSAQWRFSAADFLDDLREIENTDKLSLGSKVWLFEAGWVADSAPALKQEIGRMGCPSALTFGENIFLCQIELP